MYKEFFGLKELPFSIAPDPRYLYMSHKHREALAHLVFGISSDGGFVLLTGEVGTGKTTVCRCLLEQLPENTDVAFVMNPKMSVEELLATICDDLGIRYPEANTSIKVFVDRINAYLLDAHARDRKTVLIIEEAQNLTTDVLEQLRLLTNLETNQRKLLQIVMVGQPELQDKLAKPEMRQLAQRITARYHLGPLSKEEVAGYVNHRLEVAGVRTKLFLPSTIDKLFRLSSGIPRLINVICDRALLGAYVQGKERVDKKTLGKAAMEVFGRCEGQKKPKVLRWALAGLLLIISVAALAATIYNQKPLNVPAKPAELPKQAVAAPGPAKPDALEWPSGSPMEQSRHMAYQALFREWNIPYQGTGSAPCQQARTRGLGCLDIRTSLSALLQLNRPAMLKLFDDHGKEFYATLTAVQGQTATFVVGSETRKVAVKEIETRWLGDCTLLWQLPPKYQGDIKQGSKGEGVKWLETQLAIIQGRTNQAGTISVFDEALVRQVKQFQLSKGLEPDGIVGPQTIIHLHTEAGSDEPLLKSGKEDK
jgi:general secretion pathway protein A